MGKKYIVELGEHERLYKAKLEAFNGPVLQVIAGAPYTEPDLEQVRKEAYDKGFDDGKELCPVPEVCHDNAYQKGLSEAWEAARKIGDEVQFKDTGNKFIVTRVFACEGDRKCEGFFDDGEVYEISLEDNVEKTGRYFPEIVAVLEKMGGPAAAGCV